MFLPSLWNQITYASVETKTAAPGEKVASGASRDGGRMRGLVTVQVDFYVTPVFRTKSQCGRVYRRV